VSLLKKKVDCSDVILIDSSMIPLNGLLWTNSTLHRHTPT